MYGRSLLIRVGFCRLLLLCHKLDSCRAEVLMASDTNILASINFIAIFVSIQHYKFTSYTCYHLTDWINIYKLLGFFSDNLFLFL